MLFLTESLRRLRWCAGVCTSPRQCALVVPVCCEAVREAVASAVALSKNNYFSNCQVLPRARVQLYLKRSARHFKNNCTLALRQPMQHIYSALYSAVVPAHSGPARGPQRVSMRGEMGSPSPPQAPIFSRFFSFLAIFTCFHGNSAYLRPCYHALRQPVGAADRAMMHN